MPKKTPSSVKRPAPSSSSSRSVHPKKPAASGRKPAARKTPPKTPSKTASKSAAKPLAKLAPSGSAEAQYLAFLPMAQKIAKADILPYRLDPVLALQNIQTGLKALEPQLATLRKALPQLDWSAVRDLPALAQAVTFAATQVVDKPAQLGELRTQLAEAALLRSLLLSTAGALVLAGVLPAPAVERIRRGSGAIDLASDLVGLAALYRKHPDSMAAQKLVTATQLDQAAQLGTELLSRLKPAGTRVAKTPNGQPDVVARDRLATLLWQRHGELRKAAYYLWGDDFERYVPSLQSRRVSRPSRPIHKNIPGSPSAPASPSGPASPGAPAGPASPSVGDVGKKDK